MCVHGNTARMDCGTLFGVTGPLGASVDVTDARWGTIMLTSRRSKMLTVATVTTNDTSPSRPSIDLRRFETESDKAIASQRLQWRRHGFTQCERLHVIATC